MSTQAADRGARGLRPTAGIDALGAFGLVRRVDWVLLAAVMAILVYGLRAIDGITRHDPGGSLAGRQALYAAVGCALLVVVTLIDPAVYRRFKGLIYGSTLAMLAL